MPGLDDIDDDEPCVPPVAAASSASAPSGGATGGAAPTMDDIFGGMGEAPKPKVPTPPPQPAVVAPGPAAPGPMAAAPQQPAPAAPRNELDDLFSAPAGGAATSPATTAQPQRQPSDLLGAADAPVSRQGAASIDALIGGLSSTTIRTGGGASGGQAQTLGTMVQSDRPYVPPPGVLALMSHYELLGVQQNATEAEVAKAYKKLAIAFHPDKRGGALTPEEEHFFKAVTTANEVLSDPEQRAQYDAERKASRGAAGGGVDLFSHMS